MASLSKETRKGQESWRITWYDSDGRQKGVRLGQTSKRNAERVLLLVERLLESRRLGLPLDGETTRWVDSLDDSLAEKLAGCGLIPQRTKITLQDFLKGWMDSMQCKPASKAVRGTVVKDLLAFFGPTKPVREITQEQAEAFRQSLLNRGLRPVTVAKRLEHAKTAFRRGVDMGIWGRHPFENVKPPKVNIGERRQYVPAEVIERLLPYCPNWVWRLLLVLARYAGLRTPSEPFSLKWSDILWAEGKFLVDSPKTGLRAVPLFPRVRQALEEAFEIAEPGTVYVIPEEYRRRALGPAGFRNANLRTTLLKIIRRAGETPWPRLWHNLRASCESDLVRRYPLPTAARWLGNSSVIAYRHYVDPTDTAFREASQEDPWPANVGGKMNPQTHSEGGMKIGMVNVGKTLHDMDYCTDHPTNFPDFLNPACRKSLLHKDLTDGEGFEPPVGNPTPVFKTGALNHSATHPIENSF